MDEAAGLAYHNLLGDMDARETTVRDAVRSLTSCRQAAAQLAALEREQRNGDSYAGSNQGDDASSV